MLLTMMVENVFAPQNLDTNNTYVIGQNVKKGYNSISYEASLFSCAKSSHVLDKFRGNSIAI